MRNIAGDLLHKSMQTAFSENPRGERYRHLPQLVLLGMLRQNVDEVDIAIKRDGNDLEDKLADCGNYCAFMLRNHLDPLTASNRVHVGVPDDLSMEEALAALQHVARVAPEVLPTDFRGRQVTSLRSEG